MSTKSPQEFMELMRERYKRRGREGMADGMSALKASLPAGSMCDC